jgi:hypothetical protein
MPADSDTAARSPLAGISARPDGSFKVTLPNYQGV